MAKAPTKKKNKPSALAISASRRLQMIGMPKLEEVDVAHMMFHAEQRGEVSREVQEDGSWVWLMPTDKEGRRPKLSPTPKMLEALERFATEDHSGH